MQNPNDMWQARINGEVYETNFAELTEWINGSSLLETDEVRRGNLRWLEAGKVPVLKDFFNAKATGTEPPLVHISETEAGPVSDTSAATPNTEGGSVTTNVPPVANEIGPGEAVTAPLPDIEGALGNTCNLHPEVTANWHCDACSHYFCDECPPKCGSENVRSCPYCGAMCRELEVFQAEQVQDEAFRRDMAEGFVFGDFGRALAYPFQFKSSLFIGGFFFAIFSIGQKAAGMGSIFLIAAALFCLMLANTLSFGVLSHTVENFAQGFTNRNFMPSFDDFSLWDDVVHPFLLSVGVWIASFGVFLVIVVGMVWYTWNSFSEKFAQNPTMAQTTGGDSAETQDYIRGLVEKYKKQNEGRFNLDVGEDGLTAGQRESIEEEAEFMRLNELANGHRREQLESTFGKTEETQQREMEAFMQEFAQTAGLFLILAGLAMLWGLFYFPAACAVAGYTRSFMATVNPLVGLDTIRHLGVDYLKILVMCLLILIMSGLVGGILSIVLSPFDLPTFGNIPAQFLGSFVSFYFTAVFSLTLGYAIYKNSEKLKLFRTW